MDNTLSQHRVSNPPMIHQAKSDAKPELTAQQSAALEKAEREADLIEHAIFAASLAGAVSSGNRVGPNGYRIYLERLLKRAGDPQDPIERMLIKQMALAHFRVAQLHVQAAEATTAEDAKQYSTMAIRLAGELRRTALAIRQYRQPTTKHYTMVKQQNLSSGDQQIAYLGQSDSKSDQTKDSFLLAGSEQGSKRLTHESTPAILSESEACGSRSPQPQTTRPVNSPRP